MLTLHSVSVTTNSQLSVKSKSLLWRLLPFYFPDSENVCQDLDVALPELMLQQPCVELLKQNLISDL